MWKKGINELLHWVAPKHTAGREGKRGKVKHELRVTSSNPRGTSSNPLVTSSNPRVGRLKTRVARLKARVGRLKARVRR